MNIAGSKFQSGGVTAITGLAADLAEREAAGNPVRIGIVGAGEMGTDLVTAVAHMPGVEIAAIADRRLAGAPQAIEIAGLTRTKVQSVNPPCK